MTTRTVLADYVLPLLAVLLTYLVRRLVARFESASATREHADAVRALGGYVAAAVAETEATLVRDLKDPAKPGTWDDVGRKAARDLAVKRSRDLAPSLLATLRAGGADVDALLGALVERAVAGGRRAPGGD